ncbi:chromate transporter [Pseudomonas agarici]|nr:chromate transporter [Pseudomonas agarici]
MSVTAPTTAPTSALLPSPSLWQLFYNFAMVGLFGFGGVMPWARQMMVDRRR